MQKGKTLAQIFKEEPPRWGLRGDPYLWNEMKSLLADLPCPDTEEDFNILLEQTFEKLTGRSIRELPSVFVERYGHGGMSSGHVSTEFWIEVGFPILRERFRQILL
jgi:hypothetical protein